MSSSNQFRRSSVRAAAAQAARHPIASRAFLGAALVALAFLLVPAGEVRAAVIADVRANYQAATTYLNTTASFGGGLGLPDLLGAGHWNYYFQNQADSSLTLLKWGKNGSWPQAYGGEGNTANGGWSNVSDQGLWGGAPGTGELTWHPGGDDYYPANPKGPTLIRWTAGASEAGTIDIAGNVRLGSATFKIKLDGTELFSSVTSGTTFNLTNITVGSGSNVDFVLYGGPGGASFIKAQILQQLATANWWAPEEGGGGTGFWDASHDVWATAAGSPTAGTSPQPTVGALIFTDKTGTVTVNGTVTANAGLTFSSDGYNIAAGSAINNSGPAISLAGTAASTNTITTDSGVGATIGVPMTGSAGMTKAGAGTLSLSASLTNSSSTEAISVRDGTLAVGATGSITATTGTGAVQVCDAGGQNATLTVDGGAVNANRLRMNHGISSSSSASLNLNSGDVTLNNEFVGANPTSGTATTTINISGGTLTSNTSFALGASGGGTANVTVNQTGGVVSATQNTGANKGVQFSSAGSAVTATYNLDGGQLLTSGVTNPGGATAANQTFNFGGGTLRAANDNADLLGVSGIGNVQIKNAGAVVDTQSFAVTIANPMKDFSGQSGGLTKLGDGTLTLSGTNTYTGATTISEGTLSLPAAVILPREGTMAQLRPDYVANPFTVSQSASFADTATTGTWEFHSAQTEGHATFTSQLAYITSGQGSNVGNSFADVAAGGLPGVSSGQLIPNELAADPAQGELTVHPGPGGGNSQYLVLRWTAGNDVGGPISIAGHVRKVSSGYDGITFDVYVNGTKVYDPAVIAGNDTTGVTFNLTGSSIQPGQFVDFVIGPNGNYYTDNSAIAVTIERVGGASSATTYLADTSPISIAAGAKFDLNGNCETVGPLSGAGEVALGAGTLTVNAISTPAQPFSGTITGTGRLVKTGDGKLVLSGANTYSGTTTLSVGELALGSSSGTGTGPVGTGNTAILSLAGGTLSAYSAARSIDNPVTIAENSVIGGSQDLTLTGAINLDSASTDPPKVVTVNNTATTTFAGKISSGGLEKAGPGTLVLSSPDNDYTGGTIVSGGTLVIGSAGALPAGKSLSIGSGGTLILGGGMAMGTAASAEPVPEPGTLALLAIAGMAGVMIWRRK